MLRQEDNRSKNKMVKFIKTTRILYTTEKEFNHLPV